MAADIAAWRALVEKELAGAGFDKLVQKTPEGLSIEPLYNEAPRGATRPATGSGGFKICMRTRGGGVGEQLDGGADAVWLAVDDADGLAIARERGALVVAGNALGERGGRVSTLAYHDAGADAADELALALAEAVGQLRAGAAVGERLWFQIAVGRDTFGELCKLRALRVVVGKLLAAAGIAGAPPPIHAVCSSRTQSARDPWVNMLRVTTEVFAAAIGGADLITPLAFDGELAELSALGRRVARNTALVLRDESHLGRVLDAAGGSYYIESRTDALAREAWQRFRAIERAGGHAQLVASRALHERLAASWATRAAAIARRKEPVLGVSEFANLGETLPSPPRAPSPPGGLPHHRDAEGFEALRAHVEAGPPREVLLVTLGAAKDHRARVGYAEALFATAGVRARTVSMADALGRVPYVACLCGSDEVYAAEAAGIAAELRAAGAHRIALAGRPGALEPALRAAGVSSFIYMGCDALAALEELLA